MLCMQSEDTHHYLEAARRLSARAGGSLHACPDAAWVERTEQLAAQKLAKLEAGANRDRGGAGRGWAMWAVWGEHVTVPRALRVWGGAR